MPSNNPSTLKRVIVDFKKLNDDIMALLVDKYPYGYDEDDIITFRNAQGEIVECVEVLTDDSKYLVKVSKRLEEAMEDFDLEEYDNDNDDLLAEDDDLDDTED